MKRYFLSLIILLFVCYEGYGQLEFSFDLRLKPEVAATRYIVTESVEIKTLSARHNVRFRQALPGARNPDLLLYYTLTIEGSCMTRQSRADILSRENIINDFLATGLFDENYVREFAIYSTLCANPVSVNDPHFKDEHGWALRMINAPCAWTITQGNPNILIGIADTEFRTTHEDFEGQLAVVLGESYNATHHGTSVASVAGARANNGRGMAGVGFNSRIAAHRIPQFPNGNAYGGDISAAILNLHEMGVPVINVSWTGSGLSRREAEDITRSGTTLVLGAGNTPEPRPNRLPYHSYIADIPGVIVVSSVNSDNMHGPTNHARNEWIDIVAPGYGVIVAGGGSDTDYFMYAAGTSFAAPFVAGTVALMLSVHRNITPAQIEEVLKATADPIADGYLFPGQLGAGRLNAYAAVREALRCFEKPTVYFRRNQPVIVDETVSSCSGINIQNVTIANGATLTLNAWHDIIMQNITIAENSRLILNAGGEIVVGGDIVLYAGGELEIR